MKKEIFTQNSSGKKKEETSNIEKRVIYYDETIKSKFIKNIFVTKAQI